jgi:hypothetical protein
MIGVSIENLLSQIVVLPISEKLKLRDFIDEQIGGEMAASGAAKFVEPIPLDPEPNNRWMEEHADEYAGQWVAIVDGELLASGTDAQDVFAVAQASGAYLPTLTFIPPIDALPFAGV